MPIAHFLAVQQVEKAVFRCLNYLLLLEAETAILKNNAHKEWLRVILRTREMAPDLKQRIEKNEIYLCERHFKVEFIVDRKY